MTKSKIGTPINLTELSRTIDEFKSALFTVITGKQKSDDIPEADTPSDVILDDKTGSTVSDTNFQRVGEEYIEYVSRERLKQDIYYIKVSLKDMRRFIENNTEYYSPIRYYITQQSIAIEKTLDTIKSSVIWQNKMIAKDNME